MQGTITGATSNITLQNAAHAQHDGAGWYKEAKFGIFIRWGLHRIPGGTQKALQAG